MAQHWKHVFTVEAPDGTVGFMPITNSTQLEESDYPEVARRIAAQQGWPLCNIWLSIAPELVDAAEGGDR
jgi:hypothetical protein